MYIVCPTHSLNKYITKKLCPFLGFCYTRSGDGVYRNVFFFCFVATGSLSLITNKIQSNNNIIKNKLNCITYHVPMFYLKKKKIYLQNNNHIIYLCVYIQKKIINMLNLSEVIFRSDVEEKKKTVWEQNKKYNDFFFLSFK